MEARGYDMDDEQDLTLDNEDELDDLEGSADTDGADAAPPSTDNDNSEAESKRIADLMSKWQKAEARAKKAEEALNRKSATQTKARTRSADVDEFAAFAREDARQRLHAREPRFAKYGIEPSAISGETLEEMKASFDLQRKTIDGLESKIRNEVLQEHGFDLDVGGSNSESALPDFGSMSPEEFAKFIERRDGLL